MPPTSAINWTAELAAAGWILPLSRFGADGAAFFEASVRANTWRGELYALPWFVDVGMLYYRTDLVSEPPASFEALAERARALRDRHGLRHGLVWQAARYEGLVTVFLEVLGAHGGRIIDQAGHVGVGSAASIRALEAMQRAMAPGGFVPKSALGWQEEQTRFAFQSGEAVFMRNWPYAYALLEDPRESRVAGRVGVMPMPAAAGAKGGQATAALGGAQLAVNAHTEHPNEAWELVEFLTRPEQMLERAELAGQLPARPELYDDSRLERVLALPVADARRIVEHAEPRPPMPVYTELSQALQVHLHRALSGQETPRSALAAAENELTEILAASGLGGAAAARRPSRAAIWTVRLGAFGLLGACGVWALRAFRRRTRPLPGGKRETLLGWALMAPALAVIALVALFPLGWTVVESLHLHDLRMPWRGRPFVGLENFARLLESARFWGSLGRTALFVGISVSLELVLGLCLALLLDRTFRGRGAVRALALLPWAIPTVVAALVWRLLFEPSGWLSSPIAAWVPLVLADVWKTTPFVALLLLAGLQTIHPELREAARVDGAGAFASLWHVTLPLLRPALLVALVFRTLDALRVFDLVYVLTGGGPGTATEPIALHAFSTLLEHLRFGLGSALGVVVFLIAFGFALAYVRLLSTRAERAA
jgi:ABC-type sugar transport system permease subunit/ABC-type glycerol-3-phosphate transport system substrate-binding protein